MMIQPFTSLENPWDTARRFFSQAFWRLVQTIWEGEMPTLLASHPEAICCHDTGWPQDGHRMATGWPHGLMDQLHRKLGSHNSTYLTNGFIMGSKVPNDWFHLLHLRQHVRLYNTCNHVQQSLRWAHPHCFSRSSGSCSSSSTAFITAPQPRGSATHLISGRRRPSTKLALRTHSLNHLEGVAVYPGNKHVKVLWKHSERIKKMKMSWKSACSCLNAWAFCTHSTS